MTETVLIKMKNELKCIICMEPYTDPKILQCHHIYCQECLNNLERESAQPLQCPICRQVTPNGVAGLQNAFFINRFLEILASVSYCSEHDSKESELYCESCEAFICWKCVSNCGKHHSHNYIELTSAYLEDLKSPLQKKLDYLSKKCAQIAESDQFKDKAKSIRVKLARCQNLINKAALKQAEKEIDTIQLELMTLHQEIEEVRLIYPSKSVLLAIIIYLCITTGGMKALLTIMVPMCFATGIKEVFMSTTTRGIKVVAIIIVCIITGIVVIPILMCIVIGGMKVFTNITTGGAKHLLVIIIPMCIATGEMQVLSAVILTCIFRYL